MRSFLLVFAKRSYAIYNVLMIHNQLKKIDAKEIELPETLFIRNIENRVFQSIVLRCLANIDGIAALEGNILDNLLGKGISVEQDEKTHSVSIKVDVNIAYGINIPKKAEELQQKIAEEISALTGLHVSSIHLVFKNLISKTADAHNK